MGKIISDKYLTTWKSMLDIDIDSRFLAIEARELEPHSFTFYTSRILNTKSPCLFF